MPYLTQRKVATLKRNKLRRAFKAWRNYAQRKSYGFNPRSAMSSLTYKGLFLPDVFRTRLKYTQDYSQGPALAGTLTWNLNSIWDPFRSGIGNQPMGRDQLSTLYNRYKVTYCSYKFNFYNSTRALKLAVAPLNGSAEATTIEELEQQPYAKKRFLSSIGGIDRSNIKGGIGMKRIMGRTLLDDRDEAVSGTSPSEVAILQLDWKSIDASNATFYFTIELIYTVEFFDRLLLSES